MASSPERVKATSDLLSGLSDLEVREICLDALRRWRKNQPSESEFSLHGVLGNGVVPILSLRKGVPHSPLDALQEAFLDLRAPGMSSVFEFVNWFERTGCAYPLSNNTPNSYPITLRLTEYGRRFLERADSDHPLLPGALERVRIRCTNLPDDVVSLLFDARRCLDAMLMRPALALMGVAYERAIEEVADALIKKNKLAPDVADKNAAKRLVEVKAAIDSVMPATTNEERDRRFATHDAYDFAHSLRRRRNDASHTSPTYGFDDREETEEFLISALRHLPALWSPGR